MKNNANIMALDDFHKTPYQTAVQHKRKESAKCLKSAGTSVAKGPVSEMLRQLSAYSYLIVQKLLEKLFSCSPK